MFKTAYKRNTNESGCSENKLQYKFFNPQWLHQPKKIIVNLSLIKILYKQLECIVYSIDVHMCCQFFSLKFQRMLTQCLYLEQNRLSNENFCYLASEDYLDQSKLG